MRRWVFAVAVLAAVAAPVWGFDFSLIDEGDLKAFEVKESTRGSVGEEFNNFLNSQKWLKYDKTLWKKIKKAKDNDSFDVPRVEDMEEFQSFISTGRVLTSEMPQAEVELPYQTRLSISGRKSISVKYGNVYYFGDEDKRTIEGTPGGVTKGFEMEQELRVRIQGKVGEKITVNVNYDDTKPAYDEDARKISVVYKGDPDEVIQEAAFGDITLTIPSTRFVGYSKNVFGASVKGKYKKFNFMAIGSQTKGKTEVKEFTGETTFTKKDISDTSYTRRKYYNIDIGTVTSHLPFVQGSIKIYIDDQDASNIAINNESTMTVKYSASTQTYTGYFYELVAGRDFYVDYSRGIVTFNRSIQSNYVIAVEYKYDDGSSEVGYSGPPVMIKDEKETLSYELKNRYTLGAQKIMRDDFVIRFLDKSRNSVALPQGSYNIDYDLGLIEFTDDTPFYDSSQTEGYNKGGFADIYNNVSSQSHYIIYVEYKRKIKSYFLRPNILKGSERVIMNGRVLTRDQDYIIDYPSGFMTFLNPEDIDETTQIEVTYEYLPFGGLFKETLVGMRGEYEFTDNFFMGGTVLYNWASTPLELPQVHSTPESTLVLDTNFKWDIPDSRYFPLPTSVSGEVAQSIFNPNTIGKAVIDNMEGIRQSYSVSTDVDSWQIAATPSGIAGSPGWMNLTEDDVLLSEINENISETDDEKKNVLYLNYSLPSGGSHESSIVYPISSSGIDLSEKDSIQIWMYGDGRGEEVLVDFGTISEDADGSGDYKSEDINLNGTLDKGEDTGWKYIYQTSTYTIGAGNGELDTNDLDGDGFLDTLQSYEEFDSSDDSSLRVDWTGWKKITIPRTGSNDIWTAVKHVRITVKGSNVSGSIGIASIEAVGNKWKIGQGTATLHINAVNNYDNDEYVTPLGKDIYEDIYSEVGGSGLEKEQSLELKYDSLPDGTTAYAYSQYPQAVDFSQHYKITFLLYGEGSGVDFMLSFGSGSDYFYRLVPDDFIGWKKFSFNLREDFKETGSPKLTNITEIRVGIVNRTGSSRSGKIWVNEIHLQDPKKRIGHAWRGELNSSVPKVLKFGGSYETMDRNFQTITTPPKNQDNTTYSLNATLIAIPHLPIYGKYSNSEVITPSDRITPGQLNPYLREDDTGKVSKKSGSVGADFSMRRLPTLKGEYSQSIDDSNFTGKTEKAESAKGNMTYSIPLDIFFVPRTMRGSYRKTDNYVRWKEYKREENPAGGFENRDEETADYSGSVDMDMFNLISFKPSYGKNEKYRSWYFYSGKYADQKKRWPWSMSQDIGLSLNLTPVNWFRPHGSYSIKSSEDYNYTTLNSVTLLEGTKDASRNFSLKAGAGLPASKIIPWVEPARTLTLNADFGLDKGETYQNMENSFDVFGRLDQRYELEPSTPSAQLLTLTKRRSSKYTANWKPFSFLNMNGGMLNFLGDLSSRSVYTYIDSKKETTGTLLETFTTTWPDLDLTFGRIEKVRYTGNYMTDLRLRGNYSYKEVKTFSDGDGTDRDLTVKYGLNCRFLTLDKFDSLFEYTRDWTREIDVAEDHWDTFMNSDTYTGQAKFKLKKLWNLIAKYYQKKTRKISYSSEDPLSDTRLYSPSIRFDAVIELPVDFKLPFIKKKLSAVNRLKLISDFKAEFLRSDLNVDKDNTNKYMSSISAELDIASNMRLTFGFGGQYVENLEVPENGYFAFHIQSELVIRF